MTAAKSPASKTKAVPTRPIGRADGSRVRVSAVVCLAAMPTFFPHVIRV